MPKLIYVWNYREWGGAQIYFLALIRAALGSQSRQVGISSQHNVTVIVPEDSDRRVLEYLGELGVAVEFCDPAPAVGSGNGFFGKLRHRVRVYRSENRLVTRVIERCKQDACAPVVHIDLGFWQSFRALSRLCEVATVFVTQHTALVDPGGIRGAIWRSKGKAISRLPNFVILASNNDAKQSLRPFLTEEKFDSIRVTYTGIDPDEIGELQRKNHPVRRSGHPSFSGHRPPSVAEKRNRVRSGASETPQPETALVMTVGQFIERKGCWVVLEALRKLRDAGEDVDFVWLGTSALDAATVERINGYRLGDRFRFLSAEEIGPTRQDLLGTLAAADIFVLASFREGLPIALIEAMALGLPCIASKVGAIPEAIDHDASGLLVEAGDADALADAIRTLIHDEESRQMFGAAAKAVAFEKFDQRKTAEETVGLYRAHLDR